MRLAWFVVRAALSAVALLPIQAHAGTIVWQTKSFDPTLFTPDGRYLVGTNGNQYQRFDCSTRQWTIGSLPSIGGGTLTVADDGRTACYASTYSLAVLDLNIGLVVRTVPILGGTTTPGSIDPTGKRLVYVGVDRILRVVDATTGAIVVWKNLATLVPSVVRYSPTGQRLLIGDWSVNTAQVLDTATLSVVDQLVPQSGAEWVSDRMLMLVDSQGTAVGYRIGQGLVPLPATPVRGKITPDEQRYVVADPGLGLASEYDVSTGQVRRTKRLLRCAGGGTPGNERIYQRGLYTDLWTGQTIPVTGRTKLPCLFDATGKWLYSYDAVLDAGTGFPVFFSPDDSIVDVVGPYGHAVFWIGDRLAIADLRTGRQQPMRVELPGSYVAMSSDHKRATLFSGGQFITYRFPDGTPVSAVSTTVSGFPVWLRGTQLCLIYTYTEKDYVVDMVTGQVLRSINRSWNQGFSTSNNGRHYWISRTSNIIDLATGIVRKPAITSEIKSVSDDGRFVGTAAGVYRFESSQIFAPTSGTAVAISPDNRNVLAVTVADWYLEQLPGARPKTGSLKNMEPGDVR